MELEGATTDSRLMCFLKLLSSLLVKKANYRHPAFLHTAFPQLSNRPRHFQAELIIPTDTYLGLNIPSPDNATGN